MCAFWELGAQQLPGLAAGRQAGQPVADKRARHAPPPPHPTPIPERPKLLASAASGASAAASSSTWQGLPSCLARWAAWGH